MRAVRLVVVLVVAMSVLAPGPSDVAEAQTTAAGLCNSDSVTQFSDVGAGDYGAEYILCMKALGVSLGRADGSYGADLELTRAQMAAFLVRLWQDVLGRQCPVGVKTPFVDVADNTHEGSIDCLYGLDITKGTTAVTYGPGEKLKASQISQFLVRIYEKAGNNCAVSGEGLAPAVACLAALRIIPSEAEGSSFGSVTRDQMAVYMVGLWHNMAGRGLPPRPPARPADGTYTAVSAGLYLSCGLRSDGTVECWGSNEYIQASARSGQFSAVSAGREFSCGLHTDGSIECWGRNNYNQATSPAGRFTALSAGSRHSCGLRSDGAIRCWGNKEDDRSDAPGGGFSAVSAGGEHSCGLRSDGAIECWGNNQYGQASTPDGQFKAVSAGGEHSCGLRSDGTMECWGRNKFGQVNAPAGWFTAVSAGRFHSCAVRTNRTIACWGNNRYGEVNAPSG